MTKQEIGRMVAVAALMALYLAAANTALVVPDVVYWVLVAYAGLGDIAAKASRKVRSNPKP